jgi:hypothetical protein
MATLPQARSIVPVTSFIDEFETGGLKELDEFAGVSV